MSTACYSTGNLLPSKTCFRDFASILELSIFWSNSHNSSFGYQKPTRMLHILTIAV